MSKIWRCPKCDTINQDEKCVICGLDYDETDISHEHNGNEIKQDLSNGLNNYANVHSKSQKNKWFIFVIIFMLVVISTVKVIKKNFSEKLCYFGGHKYMVFNKSKNWNDAKNYCEKLGGHLVTIDSADEQIFVQRIIKGQSNLNYWIGLYKNGSGQWEWVDKSMFSYSNWDYDIKWNNRKPDNYGGDENYVRIYSKTEEFDTWQCNFGFWDDAYVLYSICVGATLAVARVDRLSR